MSAWGARRPPLQAPAGGRQRELAPPSRRLERRADPGNTILLTLQRSVGNAAAARLLRPAGPAVRGGGAVIQRHASKCTDAKCAKFFDDEGRTECPHCGWGDWDYPDENLKFCTNEPHCAMARVAVDTTKPHCELCKESDVTTRLVSAAEMVERDDPPEDRHLTRDERVLKALIQHVESFRGSSGTHHKSTRGKHRAAAAERHTSADHSQALQEGDYADRLRAAITKAEKTSPDSALIDAARP
jgi:hypothetical protein